MFRTVALLNAIALVLVVSPNARAQAPVRLSVSGLDYAFQGPDTVSAGPTLISLENKGKSRHEIFFVRLKSASLFADFARATTPAERQALVDGLPIGVIFADTGRRSEGTLSVDLKRGGAYVMVCNIRDAADKPPHVALGMIKQLHVK